MDLNRYCTSVIQKLKLNPTLGVVLPYNIKSSVPCGGNMKEIDDTPLTNSESECTCCSCDVSTRRISTLTSQVLRLERQVARLELQKVANENNQDDPEWY